MSELDKTDNPLVYKRLRRKAIAKKLGACTFCPPHAGENAGLKGKHPRRSWKTHRKQKYKTKDV